MAEIYINKLQQSTVYLHNFAFCISILWFIQFYKFRPFSEPLKLIGEGIYNLNVLKEVKVTDSFLDMNQDVIACQFEQTLDNCTTKHYMDTLLDECGCIPWDIRLSEKVMGSNISGFSHNYPNDF